MSFFVSYGIKNFKKRGKNYLLYSTLVPWCLICNAVQPISSAHNPWQISNLNTGINSIRLHHPIS